MSTNVARPASTFIGRAAELAAVGQMLDSGDRLVTVVGPPGIGKTRLAIECAALQAARRSGAGRFSGVWFVDLTEARSVDDVCSALASVLGVRAPIATGAGEDRVEQLGRALAGRGKTLLVLDNLEHIVHLGPETIDRWLALAERLQFLTTSREVLRLAGERSVEVDPLSVPEAGARDVDLAGSEAMQLLLDRARGYVVEDADRGLLIDIVRALDGIPLAIELAATRLRLLGPRQLVARMPRQLEVLNVGRRGAHARQGTLRGAIGWSWSLLKPFEQDALAQCAVFRGGLSPEAAEAVVDLRAYPDAPAPLDVLGALREKSLVRAYETAELPGELRLGLYESIREFGSDHLKLVGGDDAARRRHAAYFASVGLEWAHAVHGPDGGAALARLALERDNLVAAAEASIEADPGVAIDAVVALDALVAARGGVDRLLELADRAIARLDRGASAGDDGGAGDVRRVRALETRARALRARGRMQESARDVEAALELARGGGDLAALRASLLVDLAEVRQGQGRLDAARLSLDEAIVAGSDRRAQGRAHLGLGVLHHSQGRLDDAWREYDVALRAFREIGDRACHASVLQGFGSLRLQQGRLDEAHDHYEQALSIEREIGDTRVVGLILGNLAILEQEKGRLAEARARYDEALECLRAVGDRPLEAQLVGYVAALDAEEGRLDDARTHLDEALALLEDVGDRRLEGLFRAVRGGVDAALGRVEAAEESFVVAERLLTGVGDPGLLGALELHRGQLDLARGRKLRDAGDTDGAERARADAQARLARFQESAQAELPSASDDLRFALRMLERALRGDALIVAPDGAWFEPPGGERVDLSTRATLRRLLAGLARHRVDAPGDTLTLDALLSLGWPDERVVYEAGINRVHVALTTLRNLGLRAILVRREDGYLLDPRVWIRGHGSGA